MRKPWTLRLIALDVGRSSVAYATQMPRYWTRRGARKEAARLNAITKHWSHLWVPALTWKEPW